jgi:hypothetical protein
MAPATCSCAQANLYASNGHGASEAFARGNALTAIGVRLAGITADGKAQFAGSLRNMCALSEPRDGPAA